MILADDRQKLDILYVINKFVKNSQQPLLPTVNYQDGGQLQEVTRNSTDNWKRELFLKSILSIFGKINFCNFDRTTHQTHNG